MKREKLPENVRDRLSKIEADLGVRASVLRVYKGFFYVSSYENAISKITGKSKSIVRYLGKLDTDGNFVPAKFKTNAAGLQEAAINSNLNAAFERLKQHYVRISISKERGAYNIYDVHNVKEPKYVCTLDADGKEVEIQSSKIESAEEGKKDNIDKIDATILRCLSMNAKMPLKDIAKLAGTTAASIFYRKRALEKKYNIKYIAELDTYELGFSLFISMVKFEESVPDTETLMEVLSKESRVQLAVLTKGDYDIIMYIIAKNSDDIITAMYKLRKSQLAKYKSEWITTTYNNYYGYVPLRDEFFDIIEKEKVWRRSKEEPRKPKGKLTYTEYVVMRELNTNGDSEFAEIAKRYNLKPQAVQYAYHALKEKYKFITRITISMANLPIKYNAAIFIDVKDMDAFIKTRENLMLNVIEETYPTNKYALEGDINAPDGDIVFVPIYKEGSLPILIKDLRENIKGIEIKNVVILETFIGRFCYRFFDNMYSLQYKRLVESYKARTYKNLVNYDKENYESIIYREKDTTASLSAPHANSTTNE